MFWLNKRRAIVKLLILLGSLYSSHLSINMLLLLKKGDEEMRVAVSTECGCERQLPVLGIVAEEASTCNAFTSALGSGQNVVSYSLYRPVRDLEVAPGNAPRNTVERFFGLLSNLALRISSVYPAFRMRIYHNVSATDNLMHSLCQLHCRNSHVDLCNVAQNSRTHGKMFRKWSDNGRFWRFFPVGDKSVDTLLVRDSDAFILSREVAAVQEWLSDDSKQFHGMRDAPAHRSEVMAGLWGFKNHLNHSLTGAVKEALFNVPVFPAKPYDQQVLDSRVWPLVREVALTHVSYHCDRPTLLYKTHVRPFPVRREAEGFYTGFGPCRVNISLQKILNAPCPIQCRPPHHLDWTFC